MRSTLAPLSTLIPRLRNARRKLRRNLLVFYGDQPRQHLKQRHFGAEAAVDRGELDAHGPPRR